MRIVIEPGIKVQIEVEHALSRYMRRNIFGLDIGHHPPNPFRACL